MADKKIWQAVEIRALAEAEEAIIFALNELDSLGTEINIVGHQQSETVIIIGYFSEKPGDEILQNALADALQIYDLSENAVREIAWREIENRDWLAEWKKHWRPTETGKFIVAPSWETIENNDKIIIRVEPGMAFGTGTHETTKLCLKAIEENYRSEMSFLDVGTGTGILAIAAAKLQVSSSMSQVGKRLPLDSGPETWDLISACDLDADAVNIARENAELNNVSDMIEFYAGSLLEETPEFDFICANLTADVIVPLLPLLLGKTKSVLVLSGILKEQEDSIVSELKKNKIENPQIETDGEWISISVGGRQ
jgi:ribosomal protein L11 methyltransferase